MKKQVANAVVSNSEWKLLYRVGGVAALIAGIFFRRNLGVEIGLFSQQASPDTVSGWFALLQSNRLLGLAYLHIFDVVNYVLLGLMFLALYAVLKQTNKSVMAMAAASGFLGIAVYFASNTAFTMLSLSDQYAAAATEPQKTALLAAGEAVLAFNRFSAPGAHPGAAGYMSLFLVATAGLLTSLVMLRSSFNRVTAYVGILATGLDLAYCIAFPFLPVESRATLAVSCIPAAGLFLMVWHIMIGWQLYRLGSALKQTQPRFAAN